MAESSDPETEKPHEPDVERPRRLSGIVKAAASKASPYAVLIGFVAIGLAIGSIAWSAAVTNSQIDLRRTEEELRRSREELKTKSDELERVKLDFASASYLPTQAPSRSEGSSPAKTANPTKSAPSRSEVPSTAKPANMTRRNNAADIRVLAGRTATAFGEDFRITLLRSQFENNPPRYTVSASMIASGGREMKIGQVEVGSVARYPDAGGYDIHILNADAFSATFRIVRTSPPDTQPR